MHYIVAIDMHGLHAVIASPEGCYSHPEFIVEKSVYHYGTEYAAAIRADSPEEAREAGLQVIRKHFPEAWPEGEKE